MAPAPAAPSAAWAAAGPRTRGGRAGWPGARRAAARSHGCRAAGPAGRASDRPAGGDQAAAAPPRPARARAPAAGGAAAAHWLGARALADSCPITARGGLTGSEVRAPPPAGDPGGAPHPPRPAGARPRACALAPPRAPRPAPRGRQGGAGGTPGSSRDPEPRSPRPGLRESPASASPRPPELCIPESARSHALPASPDPPFPGRAPCPRPRLPGPPARPPRPWSPPEARPPREPALCLRGPLAPSPVLTPPADRLGGPWSRNTGVAGGQPHLPRHVFLRRERRKPGSADPEEAGLLLGLVLFGAAPAGQRDRALSLWLDKGPPEERPHLPAFQQKLGACSSVVGLQAVDWYLLSDQRQH
ncbi:basic proline-rich protein-like [Budorcas taxicolor]|uniref:basic proline-rich protein-like n=1 Tax=Budorcas taxicolor TaxID=37181 RepID=UPI0022851124|nr:basic proline-rich protein-like [Budorcas taxicolor]